MPTLDLLITGFGPFPGVEQNTSADLAEAVCSGLNAHQTCPIPIRANVTELSVEWQTVEDQLARLYGAHRPNLAIHFGVCSAVTGLVIESQAHNGCALELDACGALPASNVVKTGAANVLQTRLAISDIIAECKTSSVDISLSKDAGRYLCNAAYYTSLSLAARQTPPSDALFIHLPSALKKDKPNWPLFVETAQAIILGAINQQLRVRR